MISAGIIGSSGYVAGELIRLLLHHPQVHIDFIYSHSMPGEKASKVHEDLIAYPDLYFTDKINPQVQVLFLCLGHGNSKKFLSENHFSEETRIIDLGNDFRLKEDSLFKAKQFIYGLVEANKEEIAQAKYIANPGCFATAIQLALLPLAKAKALNSSIHVHAITGSTGAGRSLGETSHFSWRSSNVSIYKPFAHQHIDEIEESLSKLQSNYSQDLNFLPVRGDFTRGIFASVYTKTDLQEEELIALYKAYYKEHEFVILSEQTIHLKQVVNTNKCILQIQKIDDKVLVTAVIDNLLKGASGQAVQNMNLMFGLDESTALNLKPSYF